MTICKCGFCKTLFCEDPDHHFSGRSLALREKIQANLEMCGCRVLFEGVFALIEPPLCCSKCREVQQDLRLGVELIRLDDEGTDDDLLTEGYWDNAVRSLEG